jgi:hypothetical protein
VISPSITVRATAGSVDKSVTAGETAQFSYQTQQQENNVKTFKNQAAQGDVLFRRVKTLPKGAIKSTEKGAVVVAHSETGHHHSFDAGSSVFLYSTGDQLLSYLEVKKPAVLKHHRDYDTHEALQFDEGIFEIRRQREWAPEGWRRVED